LGACGLTTSSRAPNLPADWSDSSTLRFESLVQGLQEQPATWSWSSASLGKLSAGLDEAGEVALRAAVLLGQSDAGNAHGALIARLERRVPAPSRAHDAGDVVAASALGRACTADASLAQRLAQLASGPIPHPDLEVRVECARSALGAGVDSVVPFLVRVLRAGTPAEKDDPGNWEPSIHLTWSKHRAAEALSLRAGVPCQFRPDGSWQHQMDEATRLEQLLD
jgi:hypothetical protein